MLRFPECHYPGPFKVIIACYGILFYYLFAGFWKKAYTGKNAKKSANPVNNNENKTKWFISNEEKQRKPPSSIYSSY